MNPVRIKAPPDGGIRAKGLSGAKGPNLIHPFRIELLRLSEKYGGIWGSTTKLLPIAQNNLRRVIHARRQKKSVVLTLESRASLPFGAPETRNEIVRIRDPPGQLQPVHPLRGVSRDFNALRRAPGSGLGKFMRNARDPVVIRRMLPCRLNTVAFSWKDRRS